MKAHQKNLQKEIRRIDKIMNRDKLISQKEVIKIILSCDMYIVNINDTAIDYYIVTEEELEKIRKL